MRARLKARLPDYMVPAAIVTLEKFPLTPNGKVDRKALPRPEREEQADAALIAPRTATEELLAEIWTDVLGVSRLGMDDNFFELGGHSLLATRVLVRVQDAFGVELTMQQFFAAPTVAGLALTVEEALIKEIKTATGDAAEQDAGADLALAKE
jgi:acyl carrier protein